MACRPRTQRQRHRSHKIPCGRTSTVRGLHLSITTKAIPRPNILIPDGTRARIVSFLRSRQVHRPRRYSPRHALFFPLASSSCSRRRSPGRHRPLTSSTGGNKTRKGSGAWRLAEDDSDGSREAGGAVTCGAQPAPRRDKGRSRDPRVRCPRRRPVAGAAAPVAAAVP